MISSLSVPRLDPDQHFYKPPTKSSWFCLSLFQACSLFLAPRATCSNEFHNSISCEQKPTSDLGLLPDSWGIKQICLHCQVQLEQVTAVDHHKGYGQSISRDMGRKIPLPAFTQFLLNQSLTDLIADWIVTNSKWKSSGLARSQIF